MKKALPFGLTASFALLLVIGFGVSFAQARNSYPTFCPDNCSIYMSDSGNLFLTPQLDDGQAVEKAMLDGVVYVHQEMKEETSAAIVKKMCAEACTIYKIDGEKAVSSYEFSN